jgi:hypothetical protein
LEDWSNGVLEYWSAGVMECWNDKNWNDVTIENIKNEHLRTKYK